MKRGDKVIAVTPDMPLNDNDILLLVGRRKGIVALASSLGKELDAEDGPEMTKKTSEVF
ncbi:hypothetical protein [Pantoea sp. SO10]|uniref:hypothetical protein n=1 Tax=Pantoea sp. SO10 TaxID=2575375 RepID=UPI00143CF12F|nr:hypothetical protein [Pantoea sp. SO10]